MKKIKRFFTVIILLFITFVVSNSYTRFFKDIGTYLPFLINSITKKISNFAESVDKTISHIPTPREMIARIRNVELPIDPEDATENAYYSSDVMLNFCTYRNISVSVTDDMADIFGITDNKDELYLVYQFLNKNGDVLSQTLDYTDSEGKFRRQVKIPDESYQLAIYTGKERAGEFAGYVYDYVFLEKNIDNKWLITKSPVHDNNISMYEKTKSRSSALKSTYTINHRNDMIKEKALEITKDCGTDYEKSLKIHDWICQNIYYDDDSITNNSNTAPYIASDVLTQGRAVCLGYSNLYAALCRSIGLPCNVVAGYGLGIGTDNNIWDEATTNTSDSNHAWNEVYVDNRWIIVDTTWDSKNKIKDGIKITDGSHLHLYFDANLRFFSNNHKIIEYKK